MLSVESPANPLQKQEETAEEWTDVLFAEATPIETLKLTLDTFKVKGAPPTMHYIPEFVTEESEQRLVQLVDSIPDVKWSSGENFKLNLGQVRYPDGRVLLDGGEMPSWAAVVHSRITALQHASGNTQSSKFLRINKYEPEMGVQPHLDFQDSDQVNALLTLNAGSILDFYSPPKEKLDATHEAHAKNLVCSIYLEPRSLFLFADDAFHTLWHGIRRVKEDLITDKVLNLPEGMKVNDVVQRGVRYSICKPCITYHNVNSADN